MVSTRSAVPRFRSPTRRGNRQDWPLTVTYFPDLTPYTYLSTDPRDPQAHLPLLNVGWLDAAHAFPTGECPAELVPALTKLARVRVHQTRGYHFCEMCVQACGADAHDAIRLNLIPRGSAEFRVFGHGVVYAVPELIVHYVTTHAYLPPVEFRTAALAAA
jgi:hypothetical protein